MTVIGEQLPREQKPALSVVDQYAIGMKNDSCVTVRCLPQKIVVLNEEVR